PSYHAEMGNELHDLVMVICSDSSVSPSRLQIRGLDNAVGNFWGEKVFYHLKEFCENNAFHGFSPYYYVGSSSVASIVYMAGSPRAMSRAFTCCFNSIIRSSRPIAKRLKRSSSS